MKVGKYMFNIKADDINLLNRSDITYLENLLLDDTGKLKIVSYEFLRDFPQNDISQFCVKHGFYLIPTIELLTFLKEEINEDTDSTIEIGAGNGVMAKTLGIRAFDNFMQERADIRAYYESLQQAIVPYGDNVQRLDGNSAVKKYSPSYVIGAWCTHLYNPKEHWRGGNQFGFDEKKIIKNVKKYIHIGNEKVHANKPILKTKPRAVKENWIVSRSQHNRQNVIWIWE